MLDEVAESAALLAARPATPMFKAPYKLILLFLHRGGAAFGRFRLRLTPFLGAGVGFKTPDQLATAAMSPRPISILPTTSCGVPVVMSICVTVPALATVVVTGAPPESAAATVSL